MKDRNQDELKVGDLVKCVEPIEGFLLENKAYEVTGLREEEKRIVIIPDERGLEGHYLSKRFVLLKN